MLNLDNKYKVLEGLYLINNRLVKDLNNKINYNVTVVGIFEEVVYKLEIARYITVYKKGDTTILKLFVNALFNYDLLLILEGTNLEIISLNFDVLNMLDIIKRISNIVANYNLGVKELTLILHDEKCSLDKEDNYLNNKYTLLYHYRLHLHDNSYIYIVEDNKSKELKFYLDNSDIDRYGNSSDIVYGTLFDLHTNRLYLVGYNLQYSYLSDVQSKVTTLALFMNDAISNVHSIKELNKEFTLDNLKDLVIIHTDTEVEVKTSKYKQVITLK